jgi:hypothetical protein
MQKNTIKIITYLGVLMLSGVAVYFLLGEKKQNQTSVTKSTIDKPYVENLDDRQNRINDVINTKGKDYPRYSLFKDGPKNLIITYYQIIEFKRQQQGILVFEEKQVGEIKLIWESTDDIPDFRVKVGVYDLTGDGVNEVLALWDNDYGQNIYIYKWNGSGFDMITPYLDYKWFDGVITKELAFGGEYAMTKIFDVDKDGIPEIVQPETTILGLAENRLDTIEKKSYRAYKWDGTKYYLWKEQKNSFTPTIGADEYSVISILNSQDFVEN